MVNETELLAAVDAAYGAEGRGLASWPDPHPDRSPLNEEYSRLADPGRWRIVGARADAWLAALADTGLAAVEWGTAVHWRVTPGTAVSRTDRAVPCAAGAIPLVVARSRVGGVEDAGVTVGAGRPPVCAAWFPHCGCDACDTGSQDELYRLDAHILGIVSGAFRHLSSGDREITVIRAGWWNTSGLPARSDVESILADPSGWDEVSGASWLAAA